MERRARRILLAVEPCVLEGALAKVLSAGFDDEGTQVSRSEFTAPRGSYDAAVVSGQLPEGVRAAVVITLPDARGSGGQGTVSCNHVIRDVSIRGAERVVELLEQYSPEG